MWHVYPVSKQLLAFSTGNVRKEAGMSSVREAVFSDRGWANLLGGKDGLVQSRGCVLTVFIL